ncbi:MAG TPA: NUDIX domain-containing protein [bacterium]|nr:NUDIX domain-containing protein [bacterium]
MSFEKSIGAIIFHKKNKEMKYLLLRYPSGSRTPKDFWDFPKGHIEKGEKELDTARREVKEETGLCDLKFVDEFKEWIRYFFKSEKGIVFKTVVFYLAETKNKEIKISFEHTGFKWLSYEKAIEQLSFKNAKEILNKANTFLSK